MEIKAKDALTESGECWEPVEMQFAKWTTEGIVKGLLRVRVFYDVGHTLVAGNMLVFRKVYGQSINQGGTAVNSLN